MRKWYAVFDDDPQHETPVEETESGSDILNRFDAAAKADAYDGRKVSGMWIIDHNTEQEDVLCIHGAVPIPIKIRYDAGRTPPKGA
jgi:hypothetical protein